MSENTVNVKVTNISAQTSEKDVKDFFSFCGKITELKLTTAGETQSATVTFEKATAAKTALLLNNTQLGATQVQVTSDTTDNDADAAHHTTNEERDSDEITQEEKPRSRIVAEYLAHGYVIGDQALQRAIDLDQKHGISNRFLTTLNNINQKYHVDDRAKAVDKSYGVTQKTTSLWSGINSYFEKASETPSGKKLVDFYSNTSRQVQDIHTEARRLADLKKQDAEKSTCKCNSTSEGCTCAPGSCTCGKSGVKKVPGTDKTTCDCSGSGANCPCAPGECACASCPKANTEKVAGSEKTTCQCGGNDKECACASGKCACSGCSK